MHAEADCQELQWLCRTHTWMHPSFLHFPSASALPPLSLLFAHCDSWANRASFPGMLDLLVVTNKITAPEGFTFFWFTKSVRLGWLLPLGNTERDYCCCPFCQRGHNLSELERLMPGGAGRQRMLVNSFLVEINS